MMKYTPEITEKIKNDYLEGRPIEDIALELDVPVRSIIAKLSTLGVYKRKEYRDKRGNPPVKKEELVDRIAKLLDVHSDILESLEKANKNVLLLLEKALTVARNE